MARPQSSPILAQLQTAKTYPEQTAALQALKNEIIGHVQKKEAWATIGVLEPIVRSLAAASFSARSNMTLAKDARAQMSMRPLSDEDAMRLQALQLVASFAKGGPPFLLPLHAAGALPAVLACISPNSNAPQIVVAALKALTDIANASALAPEPSPLDTKTVANNIFPTPQHLESLCLIFSSTSPKYSQPLQIALASGLICRLCRDERHQHALAVSGVLDMLATQLASFAVAQGHVVPGAEELAYSDGLFELLPDPAHPGAKIGPILDAIGAILGDSTYRATRFVHSPALLAVFPSIKFDPSSKPDLGLAGRSGSKQQTHLTAMDYLLPTPSPISTSRSSTRSQSSSHTPAGSRTPSQPPLARFGSASAWDPLHSQTPGHNGENAADEIESPLIPWLLLQTRTLGSGYERLTAASVLAALFKAGLGRKGMRESSIGMLMVPILVDLMAQIDKDGSESEGPADATERLVLERAPAVLARLITDNEVLQKAAYDCGAAKVLTKLLKRAYQPVPLADQQKAWSPHRDSGMDIGASPVRVRLGQGGQNPLLAHRVRLRESTLKAIGALASAKEDFRTALIGEDIIPCIVASLSEFPRKPRPINDRSKDKSIEPRARSPSPAYGTNPVSLIITTCHVVRMLARSISIMRTALVDYDVASSIYFFMAHEDVNVKIAATATICNLVIEASPVRQILADHGAMELLCDIAHSNTPALRLNALWALKHFVVSMSPERKRSCLEKLRPHWLLHIITDDTPEPSGYLSRYRHSLGDEPDEEMDLLPPSDEPFRWLYATNGCLRELDASRSSRLRQAEDKLASMRDSELSPIRKARKDDAAIQEQALDFIRNLIGPATAESLSETTEMIDHLFDAFGQDNLFETFSTKLRAKVLHPFSRRVPTPGRETKIIHPQAKIIAAVIFILVHIAASIPRHRQLIIAQTDLLGVLCQQASSKEREVRVALCHLVINLTGQDDDGEKQACAERALELKKLGFQGKMEALKLHDRDLDVRERAKMAVHQMEKAIAP